MRTRTVATCVIAVLVGLGWTVVARGEEPLYKDPSAFIDDRADDLLARMTLEEKVAQLATMFPNANVRLGIPHLKSAEALHGVTLEHATSFPSPLAMGSTWDPELIERMGVLVAREARALGVHQVYSPMLGVLVDPRWGRSEESYGEDPFLVSRIGVCGLHLRVTGSRRAASSGWRGTGWGRCATGASGGMPARG